jgi:catechol 2,3-dioxygenase-like lactoylglutathione lyase family enzyme
MRADHIAIRTHDKEAARKFYETCLGYSLADTFDLKFDDGTTCECYALIPPEKIINTLPSVYVDETPFVDKGDDGSERFIWPDYHMAPEVFISQGETDSIVAAWVGKHGPGVHHIAYEVGSVERVMKEWQEAGVDFLSEPLHCPDDDLIQVFTKPHPATGLVYELIQRGEKGFCRDNVKALMEATDVTEES